MNDSIVFIDAGFLSKLSKYFGKGNYLQFDLIKFSKLLGRKKNLIVKKIFYYTAPPFQSNPPKKDEIIMKKGYDKFISRFVNNNFFEIKEGRVQKIVNNGKKEFKQKGVDAKMISDMVSMPVKFPKIKNIILVTSDTDFCPIIEDIENFGIKVFLYTYYERKRDSKFSVSHHLIDCCKEVEYLKKEDMLKVLLKEK